MQHFQKILRLCFATVDVNMVSEQLVAKLCEYSNQTPRPAIDYRTYSLLVLFESDIVDDEDKAMWVLVHLVQHKVWRRKPPPATFRRIAQLSDRLSESDEWLILVHTCTDGEKARG